MKIDSANYIKETVDLAEELRERLEYVDQHNLHMRHLESGVALVEKLKAVWDFGVTFFIQTTEELEKNLPDIGKIPF